MKSTAGQELDQALDVLEQIYATAENLKEDSAKLLQDNGTFDKENVAKIIENIKKSVEVGAYIYRSIRKVHEELQSWILTISVKYSETRKYKDMIDRISTLQDGLSDLEDIKFVQVPSEANIREAREEQEYTDVWSDLDDAVDDLASYIESAIDCIRELHPYKVI